MKKRMCKRADHSRRPLQRLAFAGETLRRKVGLVLVPLLVVVAGCGAGTEATTPEPAPTAVGAATAAPTSDAAATTQATPMPGVPAEVKAYDHAPDYSWVAGQLRQEASCWIVVYVSPLVSSAPDQYNNQFALLPGKAWDATTVKDGEWVILQGKPEPGTAPASGCSAHGYVVDAVGPNPNAPGGGMLNGGGSAVDIQVTRFSVAQNFEVRGQFDATNKGTTTLGEVAPVRIVVTRPGGEVALDGSAQGGVTDMKATAGLPPGMTRSYGFSASPGKIVAQVAEGDEVGGTLTVRAGGQEQQVALPTTRVTVARIP